MNFIRVVTMNKIFQAHIDASVTMDYLNCHDFITKSEQNCLDFITKSE